MKDIEGIPYATAEFDEEGKLKNNPQVAAGTTDLIIISHGWKNSAADATELYTKLFTNLAKATMNDTPFQKRKLAIFGVIWPAKQFDVAMTELADAQAKAGGAAGLGAANVAGSEEAMQKALDRAAGFFSEPEELKKIEELRKLTGALENNVASQTKFVQTLRELVDPDGTAAAMQSNDDASKKFFKGDPAEIFKQAKRKGPASTTGPAPPSAPLAPSGPVGQVSGQAAGLKEFFSGAANAVANLLNLATYFKMKNRAGTVGSHGMAPLIDQIANQVERIHLVGHSFGGRLVVAAATDSTTTKLHSVSLLQAAFSHNGFSKKKGGFFRRMIEQERVAGPVLITHTKNDRAVGLAYPAASRISGDKAMAFGDKNDDFGGLGSNGAQNMGEKEISVAATRLLRVGSAYQFEAQLLHNLLSDEFIKDPTGGDAHGFVFVPEVAWAISRAILFEKPRA
jgi:predicted alpha/beta hydrolase family esterase